MTVVYKKNVDTLSHLEVFIPKKVVQTKCNEELKDLSGKLKMNGFRRGNVPMSVVKSIAKNETEISIAKKIATEELYEYTRKNNIKQYSVPNIASFEEKNDGFFIVFGLDDYDFINLDFSIANDLETYDVEAATEKDIQNFISSIAMYLGNFYPVEKLQCDVSLLKGKLTIDIDGQIFTLEEDYMYPIRDLERETPEIKNAKLGDKITLEIDDEFKNMILKHNIPNDRISNNVSLEINYLGEADASQVSVNEIAYFSGMMLDNIPEEERVDNKENVYSIAKKYTASYISHYVVEDLNQKILNCFLQKNKMKISDDRVASFVSFDQQNKYLRATDLSVDEVLRHEKIKDSYKEAMLTIAISESYRDQMNVDIRKLHTASTLNSAMGSLMKAYSKAQTRYNYKGSASEFMEIPENTHLAPIILNRNLLVFDFLRYVREHASFKVKKISYKELKQLKEKKNYYNAI